MNELGVIDGIIAAVLRFSYIILQQGPRPEIGPCTSCADVCTCLFFAVRTSPPGKMSPCLTNMSNSKNRIKQLPRPPTNPRHAASFLSYNPANPIPPGPPPPPAPFAAASAWSISETFIWTSKNFAAHLSIQTPSPLLRSPSR